MGSRGIAIFAVGALGVSAGGCFAPDPPSIHSQDPQRLIPAIAEGVRKHDQTIVPFLVDDLQSDDPAIRLYAIDGLRRLTGQDFGYVAYADDDARRPSVEKWKKFVASHTF
jgi:hypothetical protein